jgi:hypothetical protein
MMPIACLVVLVGLMVGVKVWPSAGLHGYVERAKPELVLGQDKITRRNAAFLRMGLLRMSHTFCEPQQLAANSPEALALYGQACPAPDAAALQRGRVPPSTALLPTGHDLAPEGAIMISLVCRNDHLFDAKHGIVTHPHETGRHSERPAWMSARLGAQIVVESPVGLRIHGGSSRSSPHKSFSLIFRENYGGHAKCAPGLFFGEDTPAANHLVLINAAHPSRFNAALCTEIAAQMGCHTSRLTPAVVYLNGTQILSPFFVYQHQSPSFVKERFGLADVDWERLKANRERENASYVNWRQWIRKERFPTLLAEEAARYDITDISAWALAISFTSTSDNNQGAYFRDRTRSDAPWRSLVWDMDCSFIQAHHHQVPHGPYVNVHDPIWSLQGDRARLFLRLMERTEEYREYYQRFVHETLEKKLPKEKLLALADKYVRLAQAHATASPETRRTVEETRKFLESRHEWYLAYLERSLRDFERRGEPFEVVGGGE